MRYFEESNCLLYTLEKSDAVFFMLQTKWISFPVYFLTELNFNVPLNSVYVL